MIWAEHDIASFVRDDGRLDADEDDGDTGAQADVIRLLERQKPPTPSTSTSRSNWVGTIEFSEWLGIHPQTVRAIKKMENGPWRKGVHFRTQGVTGRGPIQWNRDAAEQAWIEFQQTPAVKVETFSRVPNPTVR